MNSQQENSNMNREDSSKILPESAESFKEDEIDFKALLRALLRRKKLVLVTAATIFTLNVFYIGYKRIFRPVYEGSFTILISDPLTSRSGGLSDGTPDRSLIFKAFASNTTDNDIPTLIELLKSPLVLDPIAKDFDISPIALSKRIFVRTGGTGTRTREAKGVLKVRLRTTDVDRGNKLIKKLSNSYLQIAITLRQRKLSEGLNFLENQKPALEKRTEEIQVKLANFRRENSLLEPSLEGTALKEQELGVNKMIFMLDSVEKRLLKVREQVNSGTLSAIGFKNAINAGESSSNGNFTYRGDNGLAFVDSDQSLLQQLIEIEDKLANARSKYKESSSMVQGLEARLTELKPLLKDNQLKAIDTALLLNQGRIQQAKDQQKTLKALFSKQPELIKEYNKLNAKLEVAFSNLKALVDAREQFQLEIAQKSVPWRLLSEPVISPEIVKPSITIGVPVAFIVALVAGSIAGLVRDRFDHVFHDPEDLKEELGLPILGTIPYLESFENVREEKRFLLDEFDTFMSSPSKGVDSKKDPQYTRFLFQEELRNLYTSLRFLKADSQLRTVVITSSIPAEGKSLITILFAKTLSELGQRILLIDGDMRKPTLHYRLGLNNLKGLSNLLTEEDVTWKDVIIDVPDYTNWKVITAGITPPDSIRLLTSPKLTNINKQLIDSDEFDLIIYDSPPALGLSDAELLSEHTDGLILITALGKVDRKLPAKVVNNVIENKNTTILGVVTNAIKENSMKQGASSNYSNLYEYYTKDERDQNETEVIKIDSKSSIIDKYDYLKTMLKGQIDKFFNWVDN